MNDRARRLFEKYPKHEGHDAKGFSKLSSQEKGWVAWQWTLPALRKGNCFQAAFRLAMDIEKKSMRVIHGVLPTPWGDEHIHAWVEVDGKVFDHSNRRKVEMKKLDYYRRKGVIRIQRSFTRLQLAKTVSAYNHFGPFEKDEPTIR